MSYFSLSIKVSNFYQCVQRRLAHYSIVSIVILLVLPQIKKLRKEESKNTKIQNAISVYDIKICEYSVGKSNKTRYSSMIIMIKLFTDQYNCMKFFSFLKRLLKTFDLVVDQYNCMKFFSFFKLLLKTFNLADFLSDLQCATLQ